jgi:hypothetical protein
VVWHPKQLRDPALMGELPIFIAAVDPGVETGVAIMACDRNGSVRCATTTLTVPHPAAWRPVTDKLFDLLDEMWAEAPEWMGETDPRWLDWKLAVELSKVHIRAGEATWAQVNAANDLGPTAYRAATVMAALASLLGVSNPPTDAKATALGFVADHFGAEWIVPDNVKPDKRVEWERDRWGHEAEAALIGLHHLRCLRMGERTASRLPLPGVGNGQGKRGKRSRALPDDVIAAMSEEDRANLAV